jgi:hypothetical protein
MELNMTKGICDRASAARYTGLVEKVSVSWGLRPRLYADTCFAG